MLPPQTSRTRTTAPFGRLLGRSSAQHLAALAFALVAVTACSDDDPAPTAPARAEIVLSDTSITLVRGTATPNPTKQVTASITGGSGAVTWNTPRPDIATISPDGLITAVADGSTFFTATSDADPSVNRTVVVNVVSTIVTVTPAANFSWVGGPTRTLTATVANNTNTTVTWASSNTAVATVAPTTGVVTPVAAGTATITATSVGDPAKSGTTAFTVDAAPLADAVALTSGTTVTGLSAAAGESKYFRIEVPVGATQLTVATVGGGDLDLFVRAGVRPTSSGTTTAGERCFSAGASSTESCTITNPQPRIFYVFLDAYASYTGVTLTATVTKP